MSDKKPNVIRAFTPSMKDEEKDGREPFATLTYGDTVIELDYSMFNRVRIDSIHCSSEARQALDAIYQQMHRDCDEMKNDTDQ